MANSIIGMKGSIGPPLEDRSNTDAPQPHWKMATTMP